MWVWSDLKAVHAWDFEGANASARKRNKKKKKRKKLSKTVSNPPRKFLIRSGLKEPMLARALFCQMLLFTNFSSVFVTKADFTMFKLRAMQTFCNFFLTERV